MKDFRKFPTLRQVCEYTFLVDLQFSSRGDYAVRAAICLAGAYESEQMCTLQRVSDETGVPRTFVAQILGDLVRASLALSFPGSHGGYRLARPPDTVSLLEVVEAAEGSLHFAGCVRRDPPCPGRSVCALQETWVEATAVVRDELRTLTLATLTSREGKPRCLPTSAGPGRPPLLGELGPATQDLVEDPVELVGQRVGSCTAGPGPRRDDAEEPPIPDDSEHRQ